MALARATGVPLVPVTYALAPARTLRSWDRFLLPLPFGRGVFIWGAPFPVARDLEGPALEQARLDFERIMIAQCHEADRLTGRAPVEPAEPPALPQAEVLNART